MLFILEGGIMMINVRMPLKENGLLDLVGLETPLKQVILPSDNIFR